MRNFSYVMAIAVIAGSVIWGAPALAQSTGTPSENATPTPDNAVMLTVFLKHDESRPLSELNAQLERQGFYKAFPPAGIEVVSWNIVMGIGQVVTLRLPASRLRGFGDRQGKSRGGFSIAISRKGIPQKKAGRSWHHHSRALRRRSMGQGG